MSGSQEGKCAKMLPKMRGKLKFTILFDKLFTDMRQGGGSDSTFPAHLYNLCIIHIIHLNTSELWLTLSSLHNVFVKIVAIVAIIAFAKREFVPVLTSK